jgi:hypothetical protein
MALRCFVEELSDASALKPILPQLMDSVFKLMSEVRAAGFRRVQAPSSVQLLCTVMCASYVRSEPSFQPSGAMESVQLRPGAS